MILAAEGGSVVAPVDEVEGIHALELSRLAQDSPPEERFTEAVLQWRGRTVRVLDENNCCLP